MTYLFPPSGGVGVPRFVNYARYLPEHGCDVSILTVRNPATPTYDPELARQVPPETRVFRAFNPEVPYALRDRLWKGIISGDAGKKQETSAISGRLKELAKWGIERVFCPDVQVVWKPFAVRAARRIIRQQGIDTVLVNLPPYSVLGIAAAIRRSFPRVKLILDFRDEWIENYFRTYDTAATDYKLRMAYRLERAAVEAADSVSAVTPAQLGQIRDRYPEQPGAKFIYAPNGFDPGLYQGFTRRKNQLGRMIVTYFGTVYTSKAYQPLATYLDTLEELPVEVRSRIETRFIGRIAKEAEVFFEKRTSPILRLGFMTRSEGLKYLAESDYNLLPGANPTTHAGKLFDYLGTGVPILALCPSPSEIATVIADTRSGICVDPNDRAALRDTILKAYERTMSGASQEQPNWEAIRFYEWPALVARFAKMTRLGVYRAATSQPEK